MQATFLTGFLTLASEEPGWFHSLMLGARGATEEARSTEMMYMGLFWLAVVWFVLLMGLSLYWVIKYRRVPGKIAPQSPSHNTPLEITWTVIPTLILIGIFYFGFVGWMDKVAAPADAIEMRVQGAKWNWTLTYPNGAQPATTTKVGSSQVPVMYMPAERAVRLRMNSTDVMHAFWVPDFRVKQDVLPNRYTSIWFKAKAPSGKKVLEAAVIGDKILEPILDGQPYSDHFVFCAEYCGTDHSEMAAIIRIVPGAVYDQVVQAFADGPDDPLMLGQKQWQIKCASCHTNNGGPNTGPTWKGIFGREVQFADGTSYTKEQMSDPDFFANYIRESVRVPGARIVKGFANNMTPYGPSQVSDKQLDGIIAYMKSLSQQ